MVELFGGVLQLAGPLTSIQSSGGAGEPELRAEVTKGINEDLPRIFTGTLVTDPSERQTVDPFGGEHPTISGANALTCIVGDRNACDGERLALKIGVDLGIQVLLHPDFQALAPAWYWQDFPGFSDKEWEEYAGKLALAIDQPLSQASIDYGRKPCLEFDDPSDCASAHCPCNPDPSTCVAVLENFGAAEFDGRTSHRNWRCVHEPGRMNVDGTPDPPGVGRCEVVVRAKRLSRKPGGLHLTWFDDPWTDHLDENGQLTDQAITIALWVALHSALYDNFYGDAGLPDVDLVHNLAAPLCGEDPQWAWMRNPIPYSYLNHYYVVPPGDGGGGCQ